MNYEVILEEHGTRNVQKIINSNTCVRSECSTSFDAPSNSSYAVKITATNEKGESPTLGKSVYVNCVYIYNLLVWLCGTARKGKTLKTNWKLTRICVVPC